MAQQRTVSVGIKLAASDYFAGLKKMQEETKKTATTAEQAWEKQKAAYDRAGKASLVAAAGFAAATVAAVKASADFEQQLSQVQYVSKATSKQMESLRGAAFTAGKAFGLSATQVADAQIELAKAGVSAKDILGGALPGALALAAAGQIDVAKATSIASTAMTQFGKSGKDVPHIADLLAASADRSVASVDSVGDALNQSGLVAAQFGLSIEDTVGTLTSFSKAGLNGSDAGTSFKTMLLSLASPSKQAQAALDKYNITAYDSQGAFVGITSLATQLQTSFKGVDAASRDAALSTIFGTDAIRAANVLYKQGAAVTQGFADAQSVAGAATQAAQAKLDNLNGDVQKLGAAFQNDLIKSGESSQGALRGITQAATGALDVFGSLPEPIQGTAVGLTAVGAATTAAGGAFLLLAPKVVAAKAVLDGFNLSGAGLRSGLKSTAAFLVGPYGAAFAVGTAALVSFEARQAALLAASSGTTNALLTQGKAQTIYSQAAKDAAASSNFVYDAFTAGTRALGAADAAASSTTKQYTTLRGALQGLQAPDFGSFLSQFAPGKSEALTPWKDAFTKLDASLTDVGVSSVQAASGFKTLAEPLNGDRTAMSKLLDQFPKYRAALVDAATAQGLNVTAGTHAQQNAKLLAIVQQEAAGAAKDNAGALQQLQGAAIDADGSIKGLSDTISGFGSVSLDVRGAQRDFEAAVDDATAAVKKNGHTLDNATEAGRANNDALDQIASTAIRSASALAKTEGGADKAAGALRAGRAAFITAAVAAGKTRSEAAKLADQLGLIPKNVKTAVSVSGVDPAKDQVADLKRLLQDINGFRATVYVNAKTAGAANAAQVAKNAVQNMQGRAGGGSITGPGPKGKDSVLIYAAPGEHVLTAKEVDKMGGQAGVYAFRQSLNAYAKGGAIDDSKSDAAKYDRQAQQYARQLAAEKKNLATQQKQVDAAQKQYDDIDGTKKNQAVKKAAKARLEQQQKDVDAVQKRIDSVEKKLDTAKDKRTTAEQNTAEVRLAREDFVSSERRGGQDPLGYIDQLRSMSRDDNYSQARRDGFKKTANDFERSLYDLGKQADAASKTLDDLKSSADSMKSGITSAIAGGFSISAAKYADIVTEDVTTLVEAGYKDLEGIRVATYNQVTTKGSTSSGGITADGIDAYYANGSNSTGAFANDLQQLANRGVDGRLLAEIAGYGVEQGAPIAKALLSGTSSQIESINRNYGRVQDNAAYAGGIVADTNFKALIDDAQKNADRITQQLADDSAKLRKLIASAFGLTGYAVGTMNATPGFHLVGEKGPELLRFAGGEQVLTAAQTRAQMAGARTSSAPVSVRMPDTITVQDLNGFSATMRVIATDVVNSEAHAVAVQLQG